MPAAGSRGRIAAYMDLDGTLLDVNSARLWLAREWKHRRVSVGQAAKAIGFLVAYRLGLADIEKATREALRLVGGLEEDEVRRWTHEWFDSEVAIHAAPGSWPTIAEHRRLGHALVLLTSASPYEAERAAELFGLDAWLSSSYEVEHGRFTGEPVVPLCYGSGKVLYAEGHAEREGIDLGRSYFYTDSYTDMPILERVGRPRVVSPDMRLRLAARRRGWPVLDWSSREPTLAIDPD